MAQYSVQDAKTNLSRLIASALAGHEVVIAQENVPLVRLVPLQLRGKRSFGALKGQLAIDERFNEPLPDGEKDGWLAG